MAGESTHTQMILQKRYAQESCFLSDLSKNCILKIKSCYSKIKKRHIIFVLCIAAHEFDARRRQISKNFYHVMRVSDRQALVGPPESMREHVVAASKAMKTGDWKKCKNYIINEKMNQKVTIALSLNLHTVKLLLSLCYSF